MNLTIRQGLLLMSILLPGAVAAQDAALGLNEAVTLALQQAPEVTAGEAGVESAQSELRSAGRLPDPQLIAGVDNLPVTGPDAFSTSADFMTMQKLGVMQEFPAAQKRRLQRDRAGAQVAVSNSLLQQTRLDIAREVTQAWIRMASAGMVLRELRAIEPDVVLQAKSTRSALASGLVSGADALTAEMAVVQLGNRVLAMEAEERIAQSDLARWIGDAAARPLGALPALDQLPASGDVLLASTHHHAAILPLDARIAAANTDVALAKAQKRPDWSAELTYGRRGSQFSDMVSLQFRVGLPLFSRDRQDPQISARNADLHRLEAERETELRMHGAQLQAMLTQWQSLGAQLSRYEQELLPLSQERYRAAQAGFAGGRGDLKSVLDAVSVRSDLLIDHAKLLSERGQAWAYLRYLLSDSQTASGGNSP